MLEVLLVVAVIASVVTFATVLTLLFLVFAKNSKKNYRLIKSGDHPFERSLPPAGVTDLTKYDPSLYPYLAQAFATKVPTLDQAQRVLDRYNSTETRLETFEVLHYHAMASRTAQRPSRVKPFPASPLIDVAKYTAPIPLTGTIGIGLGGGGSRGHCLAWGVLRGLFSSGWLTNNKIAAIAFNSGSSWACIPTLYTRDGNPHTLESLLGPLVEPRNLTLAALRAPIGAGQVGRTSNLGCLPPIDLSIHPSLWWYTMVRDRFMKPFGIGAENALIFDSAASWKAFHDLHPNTWIGNYKRPNVPLPIATMSVYTHVGTTNQKQYVTMDSDAKTTGTLGPWTETLSGRVSNPGFNSSTPGILAEGWTLSDVSACTSNVFGILASWVTEFDGALDGILNLFLSEYTVNTDLGYQKSMTLADGGINDNMGVCALLARGLRTLVVFINSSVNILDARTPSPDDSFDRLFGHKPDPLGFGFLSASLTILPTKFTSSQVFSADDYQPTVDGLIRNLRQTGNAIYTADYKLLPNPLVGVTEGTARVMWIVNYKCSSFYDGLSGPVQARYDSFANFPRISATGAPTGEQAQLLAHQSAHIVTKFVVPFMQSESP